MMKFSYVTNLAIATVLVVPAVTLQTGSAGSLEESLSRTLVALENLAGIEQRIEAREPGAVMDVTRWTETAMETGEDPGANDRLLDSLRAEVSQLQTQVDLARKRTTGDTGSTGALPGWTGEAAPTTYGLDEDMRRRLAGGGRLAGARGGDVKPGGAGAAPVAAVAFEEEGYAADAMMLARAYYRTRRYEEALEALEARRTEPEGRYWMARSLEKLGRSQDALEAYLEVIEMPAAGPLAERAREGTDFLRWRLEFERTEGGGRSE